MPQNLPSIVARLWLNSGRSLEPGRDGRWLVWPERATPQRTSTERHRSGPDKPARTVPTLAAPTYAANLYHSDLGLPASNPARILWLSPGIAPHTREQGSTSSSFWSGRIMPAKPCPLHPLTGYRDTTFGTGAPSMGRPRLARVSSLSAAQRTAVTSTRIGHAHP